MKNILIFCFCIVIVNICKADTIPNEVIFWDNNMTVFRDKNKIDTLFFEHVILNDSCSSGWPYRKKDNKKIYDDSLSIRILSDNDTLMRVCKFTNNQYVLFSLKRKQCSDTVYGYGYSDSGKTDEKLSILNYNCYFLTGSYTVYSDNWILKQSGNYEIMLNEYFNLYPLKHGLWYYFNNNGEIERKENWDKGKLINTEYF